MVASAGRVHVDGSLELLGGFLDGHGASHTGFSPRGDGGPHLEPRGRDIVLARVVLRDPASIVPTIAAARALRYLPIDHEMSDCSIAPNFFLIDTYNISNRECLTLMPCFDTWLPP